MYYGICGQRTNFINPGKFEKITGLKVILCDSCKWDWRSACHNPAAQCDMCPDTKIKENK